MVAFRSGKLTIDATDASCNIECTPDNCACATMAMATKQSGPWTSIGGWIVLVILLDCSVVSISFINCMLTPLAGLHFCVGLISYK
jgi:hypothetical protein